MRDYAVVPAKFWITPLAKSLRGNPSAQVVALYLKTGPHANMIGLYHCPVGYIAQDTGIPLEGASKALASLSEGGYCEYDADTEVVFVRDMAGEQIGESLLPTDKRVKAVIKQWQACSSDALQRAFHSRYVHAFALPPVEAASKSPRGSIEGSAKPLQSPIEGSAGIAGARVEGPSKPHGSQEQETDYEQDHSVPFGTGAAGAEPPNAAEAMGERELAELYVSVAAKLGETQEERARDEKSALWRGAKSCLWLDAGLDTAKGGALLGKHAVDYGDIVLQNALVAMCRDRPAGPVAWLKRALQLRAGEASKTNKQSRLEDSNAAVVASLLTGSDAPHNAQTALEAANAAVVAELLKQA